MKTIGIYRGKIDDPYVHRTWLKVVFNPILRKLGCSITSEFKDGVFVRYRLLPYPKYCRLLTKEEIKEME